MRILILIASLALASAAVADDKRKHKPLTVTKEVDKATPVMNTAGQDGATDAKENHDRSKTRAQDYNSSRSNKADRSAGPASNDPHPRKRPGATRAQDYNSSRSNTTALRLDTDDDGDSVLTDDTCRNGVDDDCDSDVDEKTSEKR